MAKSEHPDLRATQIDVDAGKLVLDVPHIGSSRVIHPAPRTVYVSKARPAASLSRRLFDPLTYGVAPVLSGGKLATVVGSAAAQLPAAWPLAAVTVALLNIAPRFTPVAWGVLVGFIKVYLLGSLSGLRHCSTSNHSRTSSG